MSAPETYTEDTPLNFVDIVVSDVDGGSLTVTLTLSDPLAGALNTGTVGGATSTFVGGVWTVSGPIADVNALLAALTFTPAANYDGSFTIATSVSDGVAPALTGTKAVAGTPVNDAPTLVNNAFPISNGGTLGLTSTNLSATDADDIADSLVFTVSGVAHGQFLVNAVPVTSFTQLELTSGLVQFVHDGSGLAPTFMLEVADPAAAVDGPYLGNIVFNVGGGGGSGGGGAGTGVGVGGSAPGVGVLLDRSAELPIVPLAFAPDILPTPLLPLVDPAAQQFLRRPMVATESGEEEGQHTGIHLSTGRHTRRTGPPARLQGRGSADARRAPRRVRRPRPSASRRRPRGPTQARTRSAQRPAVRLGARRRLKARAHSEPTRTPPESR